MWAFVPHVAGAESLRPRAAAAYAARRPTHILLPLTARAKRTRRRSLAQPLLRAEMRPTNSSDKGNPGKGIPNGDDTPTPYVAQAVRATVGMAAGMPREDPDLEKRTMDSETQQNLNEKRQSFSNILSLFWKLALPYWKEEPKAKADLAVVALLTLLQSGMAVVFSYVGRDFWNALSTKDLDAFSHQTLVFFVATVIGTPIVVFYSYSRDRLALRWRSWLTGKTLDSYFMNRNYYAVENSVDVDNPDQRISDDLRNFTQTSLQFILTIVISLVDVVAFSAILFSIYPQLFLVLLTYSGVGTLVTVYVGRKLIGLNFQQLQTEADFRYSLVRVRENSENIAFYKGEDRENSFVKARLGKAVDNYQDILLWSRNLEFFTTGYRYVIQVLPALVVAPLYFSGKIELGVVSQSFSAFNHILSDLSIIINRFEQISAFSAGIDRLGEFVEFLDDGNKEAAQRKSQASASDSDTDVSSSSDDLSVSLHMLPTTEIALAQSPNVALEIRELCLVPPGGGKRTLVRDLNLNLDIGQRLLIVGASGTGKSSLLRAIAGLWKDGSGKIVRQPDEDVFFLPQKPYCTLGSLREQLLYPESDRNEVSDQELLEVLKVVDLAKLPERMGGLHVTCDWSDILSLGEQQRLAFGRLLISKPKMAVLDEASSALDIAAEKRLHQTLIESEITLCSVGHRPSLLNFHDIILRLKGDGDWSLESISSSKKASAAVASLAL